MDKTALDAQLITIRLKRGFHYLQFFDCGRSDLWKVLVANEKNDQLDFAPCWTCLQAMLLLGSVSLTSDLNFSTSDFYVTSFI